MSLVACALSHLSHQATQVAATEVNVQLGELTLNQHHMTLLDPAVATHPDLEEALLRKVRAP